jgi:hypothetical protein
MKANGGTKQSGAPVNPVHLARLRTGIRLAMSRLAVKPEALRLLVADTGPTMAWAKLAQSVKRWQPQVQMNGSIHAHFRL